MSAALRTPCILVDKTKLLLNITGMQKVASSARVSLRPHVKTHKSNAIATLQCTSGANGLSAAKISEAIEFFSLNTPITITSPLIDPDKISHVISSASNNSVALTLTIDSMESFIALEAAISGVKNYRKDLLDVMVKIDTGLHRCGIEESNFDAVIAPILRKLNDYDIRLSGILSHAGHAYGASTVDEIRKIAENERLTMVRVKHRIMNEFPQLGAVKVSVGCSMTELAREDFTDIDEIRPGNYALSDLTSIRKGLVNIGSVAMTVASRVISQNSRYWIIDAGSKMLSSDRGPHGTAGSGFGLAFLYRDFKSVASVSSGLSVTNLSEEHGWVEKPKNAPEIPTGTMMTIVPNHSCAVMNLSNYFTMVNRDGSFSSTTINAPLQTKVRTPSAHKILFVTMSLEGNRVARVAVMADNDKYNDDEARGRDTTIVEMHKSASMQQWDHTVELTEDAYSVRVLFSGTVESSGDAEFVFLTHPDTGRVLEHLRILDGQGILFTSEAPVSLKFEMFDVAILHLFGFSLAEGSDVSFKVITTKFDTVIETNESWNLQLVGFTVEDERFCGVVEPNKEFILRNATIRNPSLVNIPAGVSISLFNQSFSLPAIPALDTVTFDVGMSCVMPGMDEVNEEPFIMARTALPFLSLFGRTFSDQPVLQYPFEIRYPVALSNLSVVDSMETAETYTLGFSLENFAFTDFTERVSVHLSSTTDHIMFKYNGNEIDDGIWNVPVKALSLFEAMISVELTDGASIIMTDVFDIDISLYFEDVLVQKLTRPVRVVPTFDNEMHADVLFVTCSAMGSKAYHSWMKAFGFTGLTSNVWDIEYFGGMRQGHDAPWMDNHKYVVFPHFNWCQNNKLRFMVNDFISHIGHKPSDTTGFRDLTVAAEPAFMFFGTTPAELEWLIFDYSSPTVVKGGSEFSKVNFHLSRPKDSSLVSKAKQLAHKVMREAGNEGYVFMPVVHKHINQHTLTADLGQAEMYRSSINRDANIFTFQSNINVTSEGIDAMDFARVIYGLLCVMPVERRVQILAHDHQNIDIHLCSFSLNLRDLMYMSFVDSLEHDPAFLFRVVNFMSSNCDLLSDNHSDVALPIIASIKYFSKRRTIDKARKGLAIGIYNNLITLSGLLKPAVKAYVKATPSKPLAIFSTYDAPVRPLEVFLKSHMVHFADSGIDKLIELHQDSIRQDSVYQASVDVAETIRSGEFTQRVTKPKSTLSAQEISDIISNRSGYSEPILDDDIIQIDESNWHPIVSDEVLLEQGDHGHPILSDEVVSDLLIKKNEIMNEMGNPTGNSSIAEDQSEVGTNFGEKRVSGDDVGNNITTQNVIAN